MKDKKPESVVKTKKIVSELKFNCELFYHEQTGKTTEDAKKACNLEANQIIKSILLKCKRGKYIGAIFQGSNKLDFKKMEKRYGYKKLRMANPNEVNEKLGYNIGGVPVTSFYKNKIKTYVDNSLLKEDFAVGAGGDEHYGMKFNPKQLIEKLKYVSADLIQGNKVDSNTFCGSNEFDNFAKKIGLSSKEKKDYEEALKASLMPFSASDHFIELILKQKGKYREQLMNIVLPSLGEKKFKGEL